MNTILPSHREILAPRGRHSGAALVVGLVLLMVITLLAISGMSTSTLELQMAGNMQFARKAFIASDFALEDALTKVNYDTSTTVTVVKTAVSAKATEEDWFKSTTAFDTSPAGVTSVPGDGYSWKTGGGSMKAYHFNITAQGMSARNASVDVIQGFYLVGPGG